MRGTNDAALDAVETHESEWLRAHRALSRLARERAGADAEQGRWLLAAARSAAHVHLGFASFNEYVERLFGYNPRSTQERLRVAEALEQLPATTRALTEGKLNWSAARELTRVAVPDTEFEWLDFAAGKTARQLEAQIVGARRGDSPSTPRDPSLRRHVLRFEVSPETLALFREAMSQLRRRSDARLDDDALLLTMARSVLGGPGDEGRSSYQVSLQVCTECGGGAQLASGELIPVSADVIAQAECDGQLLPDTAPPANDAHVGVRKRATQVIPPARRRAILRRDHHCCRVPGCSKSTFVDVHHIQSREEGGGNEVGNLTTLCGAHHRAVHRGELVIEGSDANALRFVHADGSRYGEPSSPNAIAMQTKVFSALRNLGFREAEVRAVLFAISCEPLVEPATAESLLRDAVRRLTR